MGMRLGAVHFFAAVLLTCTPAMVMAASPQTASTSSTATASAPKIQKVQKVQKARPAKKRAKSTKAARYAAPVYTSIVVDAETGRVLHESNADTRSYPASLTKMMTIYLTFEALDRGELRMNTPLRVSQRATAAAPSKLGLTPRMTITVEQAINALIVKSANDVAVVLAERLAGTEKNFADRMTAKARMLGMNSTTFHNPHGLPHPQQFSTARDMSILARRLMKDFPEHYHLFAQMDFSYAGQTYRTHNHMLEFYEGAEGLKTGYTAASGFNLVGSATRNGRRVVGVVFGGRSAPARDRQLANLMDNGFATLAGQPEETLIAGGPDQFQSAYQTAQAPATEDEAESAGDRDESFVPRRSTVVTSVLPPLPSSAESQAPPTTIAGLIPRAEAAIPKARVAKPSTAGTWGIQIGAFSSRTTAMSQTADAVAKLKSAFAGADALVLSATIKGRVIYRARVMGLAQKDLLKACGMVRVQANSACQAITPDMARLAAR